MLDEGDVQSIVVRSFVVYRIAQINIYIESDGYHNINIISGNDNGMITQTHIIRLENLI